MNTLGGKTTKIISKEESWSINQGFVCTAKVSAGTLVKYNSDGTVTPVAADTDVPFGIISAGCSEANGSVTMQTPFNAIVRGKADGAVTIGQELMTSGTVTEGADTLSKFKVATAGKNITAKALAAAATGEDVIVGVYRVFTLKS